LALGPLQEVRFGSTGNAMTIVHQNQIAAAAWLSEQRDLDERRQRTSRRLKWAILIFVITGVAMDILILMVVNLGD